MYVQYNSKELDKDWKYVWLVTDGCSTGVLKRLAKFLIKRNYSCSLCVQHDFDYTFGWKYGISKREADKTLRDGIKDAGHKWIAWVVYLGLQNPIAKSRYTNSKEEFNRKYRDEQLNLLYKV